LRTPFHDLTACDARQRRFPTGGAAYGIPLNDRTSPNTAPSIVPPSIFTLLPSVWAATDAVNVTAIYDNITIIIVRIRSFIIFSPFEAAQLNEVCAN
jgi:hypothetical protein